MGMIRTEGSRVFFFVFPDLRGGYRGESFEYVEKLIEFSDHCFAKVGNARVGKEFLVR